MCKIIHLSKIIIPIFIIMALSTSCKPRDVKANGNSSNNTQRSNVGSNNIKKSQSCFKVKNNGIVIKSGDFFSGSSWNDPHVLKKGNQYIMYASSSLNFNKNVKVYRLISKNGYDWTLSPKHPVLKKSKNKSAWDRKSVETPAVVFFKNKYHMFYTGYPENLADIRSYNIGHAISDDGINWKKTSSAVVKPTSPKGKPTFKFDQYLTAEPAPVVYNNKIYLYFAAAGIDRQVRDVTHSIGLTTSSDGVNWSKPISALKPNQSIYPAKKNYKGYSTPNAIVLDGNMHLFFDVVTKKPFKQIKLHHAVSPNGKTQWKTDKSPLFSREDFPWTKEEIRSPSVLLDDGKLILWFAGHAGYTLGIGRADCIEGSKGIK